MTQKITPMQNELTGFWVQCIIFTLIISLHRSSLKALFLIAAKNCELWVDDADAAKSLQFCPTLCDPIDGSPPGSLVPGILQARILEWVAISFSNAWKWKVKVKSLNRVWLLVTPWTAAYQAPLYMGFSGQQYWSGVPLLSPLEESRRRSNLTWHPDFRLRWWGERGVIKIWGI